MLGIWREILLSLKGFTESEEWDMHENKKTRQSCKERDALSFPLFCISHQINLLDKDREDCTINLLSRLQIVTEKKSKNLGFQSKFM